MAESIEWKRTWEEDCPAPCKGKCVFSCTFRYTFDKAKACTKFELVLNKGKEKNGASEDEVKSCKPELTEFSNNRFVYRLKDQDEMSLRPSPPGGAAEQPPSPPWELGKFGTLVLPGKIEKIDIDIDFKIECKCEGKVNSRKVQVKTEFSSGKEPSFKDKTP